MNLVGIIPTLNRPEDIVRLFDSINKVRPVSHFNFSIILVDNSLEGSLSNVSQTLECEFPFTYVHENNQGLSRARNKALNILDSDVDYVCTIDDDLILPESYLEDIDAVIKKYPHSEVIGGRVELYNKLDLPITIKTSTVDDKYNGQSLPFGFLHGCCMILSKSSIDEVGLFDENLGAGTSCGSAEDTDYYYRAWKIGKSIVYAPDWYVMHNHGRRSPDDRKKLKKNYNLGQGAFFLKHINKESRQALKLLYWDFRSDLIGLLLRKNRSNQNKSLGSIWDKWKFRIVGMRQYYKLVNQK